MKINIKKSGTCDGLSHLVFQPSPCCPPMTSPILSRPGTPLRLYDAHILPGLNITSTNISLPSLSHTHITLGGGSRGFSNAQPRTLSRSASMMGSDALSRLHHLSRQNSDITNHHHLSRQHSDSIIHQHFSRQNSDSTNHHHHMPISSSTASFEAYAHSYDTHLRKRSSVPSFDNIEKQFYFHSPRVSSDSSGHHSYTSTTSLNGTKQANSSRGSLQSFNISTTPELQHTDECQESKSKRTILITKGKNEEFGAVLWFIRGHVCVVFVEEFVSFTAVHTEQSLGKLRHTSAAWRAGLRLGDEIECINGEETAMIGIIAAQLALKNAKDLTLDIIDQPFHTPHVLSMPWLTVEQLVGMGSHNVTKKNMNTNEPSEIESYMGLTYNDSSISEVVVDSDAFYAWLKAGTSIVEINGKSTMGYSDTEILTSILSHFSTAADSYKAQHKKENKTHNFSGAFKKLMFIGDDSFMKTVEIEIKTMRTACYHDLLHGFCTYATLSSLCDVFGTLPPPCAIIDHDFCISSILNEFPSHAYIPVQKRFDYAGQACRMRSLCSGSTFRQMDTFDNRSTAVNLDPGMSLLRPNSQIDDFNHPIDAISE